MNLGELKIASYKLIDPSDTEVIAENITSIYEKDTGYSFYFLNMLNSMNSAITRIVQACILPLKRIEVECSEVYQENKKRASISLKEYATDIYKIKLIEYEDADGNSNKINYRNIGGYLDIVNCKEGKYVIYYHPRVNTLESYFQKKQDELKDINELDLNEIGLDDNVLSIIPYYVKADLLEHDKPSEAVLARNLFEQYLSNFETPEIEIQEKQKSWWRSML